VVLKNAYAVAQSAPPEPYMPKGYAIKDGQLCDMKGDEPKPFADPLYVLAMTRAEGGRDNWGRVVSWQNADGQEVQWAMPASMLAGDGAEYRRVMLDKGYHVRGGRPAQNHLHNYLSDARPPARALAVAQPGWCGERYVAPDGQVYGPQDKDHVLLQTQSPPPRRTRTGTLEGWQSAVGTWAVGNARLTLGLCLALAGPALKVAGAEGFGVHLAGGTSGGKTTTAHAAAGVWGFDLLSWRRTDNGAEGSAAMANDAFLALDEVGQADPRALAEAAYMLANGQGKTRAGRTGEARAPKVWRITFLSTGEQGIADKMAEAGKRRHAGQEVRILEVPADAGAGMGTFETLHGHPTPAAFAEAIAAASREHCGHAADAFLGHLVEAAQGPELGRLITGAREAWVQKHTPQGAAAEVRRAAKHFAILAVAGHLAATWGVVPWPEGWASEAAARCFADWIAQRGGTGSHEVREGLEAIAAFIRAHGASRFEAIGGEARVPPRDRAGFVKDEGGCREYMIFKETLEGEVLRGSKNLKAIVRAAAEGGLMVMDPDGKPPKRVLPGLGRKRVYVLSCLADAEGGAE
jgi:putative DNA primase/helicase